uniref:protein-tyrosine-phosphatase n=1 Tax=Alexandrium monilatum TaxID=311494 RepID=A0A7S4RY69_9DINO|mmetsp:Transcript_41959/g.125526  ORF Transcript_41959/g.125526 Transcript_41959/m.125526 type:complete len:445 (+) Transcript_41959:130-1464(+)
MAAERDIQDAVEVIPDRLYWAAVHAAPPRNTEQAHYFSIDTELVYEPFFADFGPLNLAMIYTYSKMLEAKMADPKFADKRIVHYTTHEPKKRTNAACLMCAYQVASLGRSAEMAYEPFRNVYPPFLPYRDASCGICTFQLTIMDCMQGLEASLRHRWFDLNRFDVSSYNFFEKVENGDMNWIIPDKFLAFVGPSPSPTDADGFPAFMPEDYVPIFKEAGIGLICRLNKKQYDRQRFIDHGIKHVDLYFLDGSCPSRDIISKFLHIVENEPGGVAVHCKAGLGRTGTLIGLYAMKHYHFPARAFIGWIRICRPGSILGPQQQFLVDMQNDMFQAGSARRIPCPLSNDPNGINHQIEKHGLLQDEEETEYSQEGDRLCRVKRNARTAAQPRQGAAAGVGGIDPQARRNPAPARHVPPPAPPAPTNQERPERASIIPRGLRGIFSSK